MQRRAARGQDLDVGAGPQHPFDQCGARVHHVLAVIQHQQQPLWRQEVDERVHERAPGFFARAHCRGDRLRQADRIGERRQLDEPRTVGEPLDDLGGGLEPEARLARPAGTGEREQARARQQPGNLGQLGCTADEGGELERQVGGTASSERSGGKSAGSCGWSNWETRSGRARSLSRWSPRSSSPARAGSASRTSATAASESTTCPPWAVAISRAQRYSGAPK